MSEEEQNPIESQLPPEKASDEGILRNIRELWFGAFGSNSLRITENEGLVLPVKSITSDYTAINQDTLILADTTAGDIDLVMPDPPSGKLIIIIKTVAANNLNVSAAKSGQFYNDIGFGSSKTYAGSGEGAAIIYDSSEKNWFPLP